MIFPNEFTFEQLNEINFKSKNRSYKALKELCKDMLVSHVNNSMLIVHINILSLPKNLDSLKTFLNQFVQPIDVACLREIRLNDCNVSYCIVICRNIIYVTVILKIMLVEPQYW